MALTCNKESASNAGARDSGLIPGLERSPREGNGNPFQYSYLENPMDRGAWQATVHEVAKSQTRLSDYHFHMHVEIYGKYIIWNLVLMALAM